MAESYRVDAPAGVLWLAYDGDHESIINAFAQFHNDLAGGGDDAATSFTRVPLVGPDRARSLPRTPSHRLQGRRGRPGTNGERQRE